MAVLGTKLSTKLQLKIKTGVDENGNDVIANSIFNKVKTTALDDDVFAVAQQIGGLMTNPITSVQKIDTTELVNQA